MANATVKTELFEQFARIGKALSSAKRLEMLEFIAQAERSVETLARMTKLSVANTSQHLQQLRQAGLVGSRKEGLYVYYSLAGDGIVRLLAALRAVGRERLAEVDKLVRLYLDSKDSLEPVPAKELMQRAKKGLVTVLDVRPPEEFAAGHIRGAINVPVTELKKRLHEIPREQEVVAYCRGPYCLMAFDAVAALRNRGRKARRLQDGFPSGRAPVCRSIVHDNGSAVRVLNATQSRRSCRSVGTHDPGSGILEENRPTRMPGGNAERGFRCRAIAGISRCAPGPRDPRVASVPVTATFRFAGLPTALATGSERPVSSQ